MTLASINRRIRKHVKDTVAVGDDEVIEATLDRGDGCHYLSLEVTRISDQKLLAYETESFFVSYTNSLSDDEWMEDIVPVLAKMVATWREREEVQLGEPLRINFRRTF